MTFKIWSVKNYLMSKEEIEKRNIDYENIRDVE
jgi:hypothetical protein